MKLVIPINQKASIAAGYDAPNSTEVFELPAQSIPEDIRATVAGSYNPATGQLDHFVAGRFFDFPLAVHPITPDRALGWLRGYCEARAAEETAYAARRAEEIRIRREETEAVLRERRTRLRFEVDRVGGERVEYRAVDPDWPYQSDSSITGSAEARAWKAELDAANAAAREAAIDAVLDARDRKAQYVADWVWEHGTESQKTRFTEGLLPRDEILAHIEDAAIPFPEFDGSKDRAVDGLPEDAYASWQKIREKLPNATATFRVVEVVDYDDDGEGEGGTEEVYCAAVTATVGPFVFNRLIRL